jgi:hypothetical protein
LEGYQEKNKLIKSITNYFKLLYSGIVKLLPKKKEVKLMTLTEAIKYYHNFSKNQLLDILAHLIADRERLIPKFQNKKKQREYSKRNLIKMIIMESNKESNGFNY